MLIKLLVDSPSGKQELLQVDESGGYFDVSRVLWDERLDGPIPAGTLGPNFGGWVKTGKALSFDAAKKSVHDGVLAAEAAALNQVEAAKAARRARAKAIDSINSVPEIRAVIKDIVEFLGLQS